MRKQLASVLLSVFVLIPSLVYASIPPILRIGEVKPGTKAVGFSVFKGTEPEKFDVELRGVVKYGDLTLILVRISGGPLEAPLEKIGAIAGMSGSPIFVNCSEYNECISRGTLVGSLSYRLGNFILDGFNAALTPAEDLFGKRGTGYMAMGRFANQGSNLPDYSKVLDGKLESLVLLSPFLKQLPLSSKSDASIVIPDSYGGSGNLSFGDFKKTAQGPGAVSDIKPGSMISVLLAKGDYLIPASGTVTWRDGDLITAFGHPLFGRGLTAYEFYQTAVADILQVELSPQKIVGEPFGVSGVLFMDGSTEIIGEIGRSIPYDLVSIDFNVGGAIFSFTEEIAPNSESGRQLITALPTMWSSSTFGDFSGTSLYYKVVVRSRNRPDIQSIIVEDIVSVDLIKLLNSSNRARTTPFAVVTSKVQKILEDLDSTRADYSPKEIFVYIESRNNVKTWVKKSVSLSKGEVKPGETVTLSLMLAELSDWKSFKTLAFPVKIPENISFGPDSESLYVEVFVQGGLNFEDYRFDDKALGGSRRIAIDKINDRAKIKANQIYVQLVIPRQPKKDIAPGDGKGLVGWQDADATASLNRLREDREKDVILIELPALDDVVFLGELLQLQVVKGGEVSTIPLPPVDDKTKEKRRLSFLMFWRWF